MIPQSIIEAIAAHNKKGNADAIDTLNYAVKAGTFALPYSALLEFIHMTPEQALDDFVSTYLTGICGEKNAAEEMLGYSILVGEDPALGPVLVLHIFLGVPMTAEQKEIRKALSELSDADRLDYNNMLTALRKVLSPAAFDAYRKALSMAGITRNQWNQEQNKGKIPRYTGPADGNVLFYPGTRFSEPPKV